MLFKAPESLRSFNALAAGFRYALPPAAAITCVAILVYRAIITTFYDPTQCLSMAQDGGFWMDPAWKPEDEPFGAYTRWQPHSCYPYNYTWTDVLACMPDGKAVYVGDSTVVNPYMEFVDLFWDHRHYFLDRLGPMALTHKHIAFHLGPVEARYLWEVFVDGDILEAWHTRIADEIPEKWNSSGRHELAAMEGSSLSIVDKPASLLFVGTGLWELRGNKGDVTNTTNHIDRVLGPWIDRLDVLDENTDLAHDPTIKPRPPGFFYINPLQQPEPLYIPKEGYDWLSFDRVVQVNKWLRRRLKNNIAGALGMFTFNSMTPYLSAINAHDGQHAWPEINREKNNLMLNHKCNQLLADMGRLPKNTNGMCCVASPVRPWLQWGLVITALVTSVALFHTTFRAGGTGEPSDTTTAETSNGTAGRFAALRSVYSATAAYQETYPLVCQILLYALVVSLSLLADRTFMLATHQKYFSFRMFFLYNTLIAFTTLFTQSKIEDAAATTGFFKSTNLRIHTDEWKGWLTLVACGIEYFVPRQSADLQAAYNFIAGAFIFMFAYGNTVSILSTQQAWPVLHKTLRLNILSICLGLFVPGIAGAAIVTYTLLLTASLWLLKAFLQLRRSSDNGHSPFDLVAPAISLGLSLVVHHFTPIFEIIASPVNRSVLLTFPSFNMSQALGSCVLFLHLGYMAALDVHQTRSAPTGSKAAQELYSKHWQAGRSLGGYRLAAIGLFVIFAIFTIFVVPSHLDLRRDWIPGWAHNYELKPVHTNILTAVLPQIGVMVYPLLRAVGPLQRFYSPVLAWVGYHSLEIYILRQHLWLGADGAALTRLALFDWAIPAGPMGRRIMFAFRGVDMLILGALVLGLASMIRHVDFKRCVDLLASPLSRVTSRATAGGEKLGAVLPLRTPKPGTSKESEGEGLLSNGQRS